MKRAVFIPLIVLLLASMACSAGSVLPFNGDDEEVRPTSPFEGTEEPATPTPEGDEVREAYDDFSVMNDVWGDTFTVTTQAQKNDESSQIHFEDGRMQFQFLANETYAYKFYNDPIGPDAVLEVLYQAGGALQNGIALVCRVNEDRTAWYEFRVTSNSLYYIFRYDAARKADSGKNPYILLDSGGVDIETLYPTRENVFRVTCDGSSLSMGTNGTEIAAVQDGTLSEGDWVGIGAMSTDLLPVSVYFDYFSAERP